VQEIQMILLLVMLVVLCVLVTGLGYYLGWFHT
jgi:hypothetical protein